MREVGAEVNFDIVMDVPRDLHIMVRQFHIGKEETLPSYTKGVLSSFLKQPKCLLTSFKRQFQIKKYVVMFDAS